MSGLVRWIDDIPSDAHGLECPRCHITFQVENGTPSEDLNVDDMILCLECGESGLIPRSAKSVRDRYPDPLGLSYTPIPNALFDHGSWRRRESDQQRVFYPGIMDRFAASFAALDSADKAIILALEHFRRPGKTWVYPSVDRIARTAGCSAKTVQRCLSGLEALGLLERSDRRDGPRDAAVVAYSIERFWDALARVAEFPAEPGSTCGPRDHRSLRSLVPRRPTTGPATPDHWSQGHPKKSSEEDTQGEEPSGTASPSEMDSIDA